MIGTILGSRYELIEKVGEGGMAVVYKAKCLLLNRYVAVKILKPEYCNNIEFMNKFKKEAAATASFSHNNIVNIYDVGSEGNINYIVMELVKGKTLKEVIRESAPLKTEDILSISIQIAKALECAHKNNIIHRDIKPHNILVTEDGTVKVTDFGIAKATSSDTITHTNKVIGSAHYFSPEQAKGKVVDNRTDIYSLGIVMYEMATGKVPFDGDSAVVVALKHIQDTITSPKSLVSTIPESLNHLILKATEKEPIRRYNSASDMLVDLKKIQNNTYTIVKPTPMQNEFTKVMDLSDIEPTMYNKNVAKSKNYVDSDDDYDEDEDEDEEYSRSKSSRKKSKNSSKKIWLIGIPITILVVVLGIFAGNILYNFKDGGSKKELKVPTIIGSSVEEGKKAVEELNLKFDIEAEIENEKPKGTIISVTPNEGTIVKKESTVVVTVSAGPKELQVPSEIIGLGKNVAQDYIVNLGLKVGKITEENSEDFEEGTVITTDPKPNTSVKKGDTINIVVSKGTAIKYTRVPDLADINLEAAKQVLQVANLKLGEATPVLTNDKSKDGKIFNQSINPNTKVKHNEAINVNYYKYEDPDAGKVEVPELRGSTPKDIESILKNLGLKLEVNGDKKGLIINQSISPGQKVEKGTTIIVTTQPQDGTDGNESH